jgi:hypothetical protein
VKRSELSELHYITLIENVPSILKLGLLSHHRAKAVDAVSVAMPEIQDIRAKKKVPGGRRLHDYTNLYLCARNPMLYKRQAQHGELCVLKVSTDVLDLPRVVIADGNAASDYTAFWPSPSGLERIDKELLFAEYWTDANQIVEWDKKRVKCAEVLVPDCVPPGYIQGCYVSCDEAERKLRALGCSLAVWIDPHLFFRS